MHLTRALLCQISSFAKGIHYIVTFSEVNSVKIQIKDGAPVEKQSHDEHHVLKEAE